MGAMTHPSPVSLVIGGIPITVMRPDTVDDPMVSALAPVTQPMLPLETDSHQPAECDLDLQRAAHWVTSLAHAAQEVLTRRRPASQLRGLVDDDSVSVLAAWARLGAIRPVRADAAQLQVVNERRIEGWFAFHTSDRVIAATVTLERDRGRWHCTGLHLLAPSGLTTYRAA